MQSYQMDTYLPADGREIHYRRPKLHHNYGGKLPVWQCFTCGYFPNRREDTACVNCDRGFIPSWECYCLQINACGIEPTCTRCGVVEGCVPAYNKDHDIVKAYRRNVHADSIICTAMWTKDTMSARAGDQCQGSWTVHCSKYFRFAKH
jgi:hypothetical protein